MSELQNSKSNMQDTLEDDKLVSTPFFLKFLLATAIAIVSFLIIMGLGAFISSTLYSFDILDYFSVNTLPVDIIDKVIKMQYASQTIGLFGIIPLTYIIIFYKRKWADFLKINTSNNFIVTPIVILATVLAIPFINFIAEFNAVLLDVLLGEDNYFKLLRDLNIEATKNVLETNSIYAMLSSILVVAVLPGIFEELCFRGGLQNLFLKRFRNYHFAIIFSGFIFAVSHFEFYGLISRMLMGVMFGYLYYWTKNLWIPILAHFANNTAIVIIHFYIYNNVIDSSLETLGGSTDTMLYGLLSGIVATVLFFIVYKKIHKQKELTN